MRDLRYQKNKHSPDEMIKHLSSFKLKPKFSVGIWYFSPGGGRFHDRFVPEMTIEERISLLAEMKDLGIDGVEAHYPNEIKENNVHLYKNLEKETGIKVVGIPFAHFYDKQFEFGAVTIMKGVGWYSKNEIDVMIVIIRQHDKNKVLKILSETDETAFVSQACSIFIRVEAQPI